MVGLGMDMVGLAMDMEEILDMMVAMIWVDMDTTKDMDLQVLDTIKFMVDMEEMLDMDTMMDMEVLLDMDTTRVMDTTKRLSKYILFLFIAILIFYFNGYLTL